MFSFSGGDLLALSLIIIISYWIAFKTGLADFLVPSNRRKRELKGHRHNRGTITWKTREQSSGPIIKKFDVLVIYRGGSKTSAALAEKFSNLCSLMCELLDLDDGCDFEVLEYLQIPVVFILDESERLHTFIMKKESDPKGIRAYKRRHLSNLRFAVVKADDAAFSQFIDEGLAGIGGKRVQGRLENEEDMGDWAVNFVNEVK